MLTEGQILEGKYRVQRLLSKGGMGAVFVGEHTHIKRKVAIKVLHEATNASADAMRRFEKEAQAAGQIGSDHIVEVLDLGTTPEGDRFMVMEFLDGEPLTDRIKKGGRLTPAEAVALVTQLCEGLAAAHAAGIIHRDLKPDNVFVLKEKAGRRDFVKIVDFGVSKFSSLEGGAGGMTKDGAVMGTPYYMSPEQARSANEADARSDVYSVGVILYEAVTGIVPFQAATFTDLLFKIVFEQPPHPNSIVPDLDRDFATLVMTAMARDPAVRFQSALDLKAALERWLASRGGAFHAGPSTHRSPAAAALAAPPVTGAHPTGSGSAPSWGGHASGGGAVAPSGFDADGQPTRAHAVGPSFPGAGSVGGGISGGAPTYGAGGTVAAAPPGMGTDTQRAWQAASGGGGKRTGAVAAAVLGAVVLGGAAAFFVWSKAEPAPAAPAPTLAVPTATETAAPATAEPAATAVPTAEPSASAAAPAGSASAPTAATASAPPPAAPATGAVSRRPPPAPTPPKGAPPPAPATGAKPASTVKDFGY